MVGKALFEDPDGIRLEVNDVPGKGDFVASDDLIRVDGQDIIEVPG